MNVLSLLAFQDSDADGGDDELKIDISCDRQGPFCESIVDWTGSDRLGELISYLLSVPIKLVVIWGAALILNRLARGVVTRVTEKLGEVTASHGEVVVSDRGVERVDERAKTVRSLLRSVTSAVVFGTALMMSLEALGFGIMSAIASAGVLGLAIGFGAQSVVEDFLRGVFMLGEDQFGVGDRIDVGVVNGTVERITLRTTVIRDPQGTVWHIPNSQIDFVANEAQLTSRACVMIGVAYSADLDEAIAVLEQGARDAADDPDWRDYIVEEPEVTGVERLSEDSVDVRVITWVAAGRRRNFERHLRLCLKAALDAASIEMPNRQVDIWVRGDSQPTY
jgi:small conductance mechanosensitive channel